MVKWCGAPQVLGMSLATMVNASSTRCLASVLCCIDSISVFSLGHTATKRTRFVVQQIHFHVRGELEAPGLHHLRKGVGTEMLPRPFQPSASEEMLPIIILDFQKIKFIPKKRKPFLLKPLSNAEKKNFPQFGSIH